MKTWHLGPERAAEWQGIRLEALREAPLAFDDRLADWQDRPLADFAEVLAAGRFFAAGEAQGVPLAVAGWYRDLDPRDPGRAWLMSVYARPAARGRGFAAAVIEAVARDAAAAGMGNIGLHVGSYNAKAQRLYAQIGFCATTAPPITNCNGVEELEMIRPLRPA